MNRSTNQELLFILFFTYLKNEVKTLQTLNKPYEHINIEKATGWNAHTEDVVTAQQNATDSIGTIANKSCGFLSNSSNYNKEIR